MTYTINKLAKLAGITVRTLHHYDQIGLLKPSLVANNGYRHYKDIDLQRLQQILFFRELEFTLDQIKSILDSPHYDLKQAFQDQLKLLHLKQQRTNKLIINLQNTMNNLKHNQPLTDEELYEGLTKEQIEEYKQEVKQKYNPLL